MLHIHSDQTVFSVLLQCKATLLKAKTHLIHFILLWYVMEATYDSQSRKTNNIFLQSNKIVHEVVNYFPFFF